MSILIKGIDMPSKVDLEFSDNYILLGGVLHPIDIDQLVYIPTPHGRLIDADNIDYDDFWYREGQGFTIAVCQGAQRIIEEQPTILEAEE